MKTNREKYDFFCGLIANKDAAAIKVLLPTGVPSQFYAIENFEAAPITVTNVRRMRNGFYVKAAPDRIMTADVAKAQNIADTWAAPTLDDLYVFYSRKRSHGTESGAHPFPKIGMDPMMAWGADFLMPEIERRRALYEPREGNAPCGYCQRQTPVADLIDGKIFYRDRGGSAQKVKKYCSPKCHGNDQCGHEG